MCFFFKQKTAYEMRISDWSSDVCSSDLFADARRASPPACADRDHRPILRQSNTGALREFILDSFDLPPDKMARPISGHFEIDVFQIGRASCRDRVCQYV